MHAEAGDPLLDTLRRWRAEGYVGDFSVHDGRLRCGRCNDVHAPEDAEILDVARFEGASDPDDEAICFALRCVHCASRGILVSAYGPSMGADEAAVIVALSDARRGHGRS